MILTGLTASSRPGKYCFMKKKMNKTVFHGESLYVNTHVCVHAQSCLTLSDHMNYSPPGSSVYGIFQARIME